MKFLRSLRKKKWNLILMFLGAIVLLIAVSELTHRMAKEYVSVFGWLYVLWTFLMGIFIILYGTGILPKKSA